jgi:uncharacterized protein
MQAESPFLIKQKRVHAHRPGWKRMLNRRFYISTINEDEFSGFASLVWMDEVCNPLVKTINGNELMLVGKDFSWLQYYPLGKDFSAVATFDPVGQLVQWYVDVISAMGVDEAGWPWYDDLYLDVVATPEGWVEIIDGDDLDDALINGVITKTWHDQAWKTADRLADEFRTNTFHLSQRARADREHLLTEKPLLQGSW